MKSIKEQVIDSYDKHYVSSCSEVVDLTLEKVEEKIDKLNNQKVKGHRLKYGILQELKLSLKGGKKNENKTIRTN